MLKTVKIATEKTEQNQHGYVIINESDFDKEKHTLFEEKKEPPTREKLDVTLDALPGDYTDVEYVVNGLRRHFGGLFTPEDEARARAAFKPAPATKGKSKSE